MKSSVDTTEQSLPGLWAKKYLARLVANAEREEGDRPMPLSNRAQIAEKLLEQLRFCSSQAWTKTENLLIKELPKYRIDTSHIDPWKIAADSHKLFEKACESYQYQLTPEQFSVIISPQCGQVRKQHTAIDPRLLGFLSMQFHYTGKFLLATLTPVEQVLIADYFKVMDDHLYMPLQRVYDAAANHAYHDPVLVAVRQLLPLSTRIAEFIAAQVADRHSTYRCHSGTLHDAGVKVSSIRDIEMFQIYLCLCVLEGNISSIQQELFPLCVMLYPPLHVRWSLVRQLVEALQQELQTRLSPANFSLFAPYLQNLQSLFSEEIFPEDSDRSTLQAETRTLIEAAPLAS